MVDEAKEAKIHLWVNRTMAATFLWGGSWWGLCFVQMMLEGSRAGIGPMLLLPLQAALLSLAGCLQGAIMLIPAANPWDLPPWRPATKVRFREILIIARRVTLGAWALCCGVLMITGGLLVLLQVETGASTWQLVRNAAVGIVLTCGGVILSVGALVYPSRA